MHPWFHIPGVKVPWRRGGSSSLSWQSQSFLRCPDATVELWALKQARAQLLGQTGAGLPPPAPGTAARQ